MNRDRPARHAYEVVRPLRQRLAPGRTGGSYDHRRMLIMPVRESLTIHGTRSTGSSASLVIPRDDRLSGGSFCPTAQLPSPRPSACPRRQLLIGAGAGGVALLAACGSSGGSSAKPARVDTGTSTTAPASYDVERAQQRRRSKGIIALSAVPSDSAVSVKDSTGRTLLITQSGGKLTALDATCTHMGCTVAPDGASCSAPATARSTRSPAR